MEVLRRVPLLEGVDEDELAELAERFRVRLYDRGSPVVSKGSAGAGFFIIAEGEATVGTGGRATGHLSKNDFFGEVALIDGGRRSADITADTNMRCWGISKNEFRTFVKGHPDVAWAMLEVLAARLRAAERPAPVAAPARASDRAPSPEPAPASRRRWPLRK